MFFRINKILNLTIILVLWQANIPVLGSELYFENLSGVRGLPKTGINRIIQDKEGFIWIGTKEGIYRFDGYEAINFGYDPNNPSNSLPSQVVFDVFEDSKGRIWLGCLSGLVLLNKFSGEGTLYQPVKAKAHTANIIKSLTEDDDGNIWLGSEYGIIKFLPESSSFEIFSPPGASRFPIVQKGKNHTIWGITGEGLCRFNAMTETFEIIPIKGERGNEYLPSSIFIDNAGILFIKVIGGGIFKMDSGHPASVKPLLLDKNINEGVYEIFGSQGVLWLSSGKGITKIDLKNLEVSEFNSDPNISGSLSSNIVFTTYVDKYDQLWVGTNYGLNKAVLAKKPFLNYQMVNSPNNLIRSENQIQNVLVDKFGKVWLVSKDKGICWWDEGTRSIKQIPLKKDFASSLLSENWGIVEDYIGKIWVGSSQEKGLFEWDREKEEFIWHKGNIAPTTLSADKNGNIWIGSYKDGLAKYNSLSDEYTYFPKIKSPEEVTLSTRVFHILAGNSGIVWAAIAGMGVFQYDPTTGEFTQYHIYAEDDYRKISDITPLSLHEDQDGVLWIGTVQGGLNKLDLKAKRSQHFTTREGLSSNRVNSISEDRNGIIWLGTDKGLSRFDPFKEEFHHYEEGDGLLADYFLERSSFAYQDKMYFGTNQGLMVFHPDSVKLISKKTPVFITQVKVLDQKIGFENGKVKLNYLENFLYIDFTAINYHAPDKTQFLYRMEGVDGDWVNSGSRRFASYSELNPGTYTFQVKALSDQRLLEESIAEFHFRILPPWWDTVWAYIGYLFLLLGFLFLFKRFTIKREQLRHALVLKQLEADKILEIDHLKSRFFANISHEFRTPLTLILGPLEKLLSKNEMHNDQSIFLMMHRNAIRLQQLINQLLDLSKLESGKMELHLKPVALTSFLKVLVYSFSSLAERKQINYTIRNPQENPLAYFDADKLEKILNNLISNSFKFSRSGGSVLVNIQLKPFDNDIIPSWVKRVEGYNRLEILEIQVEDKGIGMSEVQLNNIFNRFYQIDESNVLDMEGSGIGLSLVKELVELYEGDIKVSSLLGEGTIFKLQLALPMLGQEELSIVSNYIPNQINGHSNGFYEDEIESEEALLFEGDQPIVLLVEDNKDVRQFIFDILKESYQIIEANDGLKGYNKAIEYIPDLILSDVMMPEMDGVQLCQKLKENEITAHIPIILLTARASGGSKIEGLQTGADDYIIKPFEASELMVRIHNLIETRKKLQAYFSQQIMLQPSAIKISSLDEQFLQKALNILEEKMTDHLFGVEAFSKEMGMSRMQLHRKLKALTKLSPGNFIQTMRLKRAEEILSKGGGNVAEVSWQVGFQDPSYFSKCYQKKYGKKPSKVKGEIL